MKYKVSYAENHLKNVKFYVRDRRYASTAHVSQLKIWKRSNVKDDVFDVPPDTESDVKKGDSEEEAEQNMIDLNSDPVSDTERNKKGEDHEYHNND